MKQRMQNPHEDGLLGGGLGPGLEAAAGDGVDDLPRCGAREGVAEVTAALAAGSEGEAAATAALASGSEGEAAAARRRRRGGCVGP